MIEIDSLVSRTQYLMVMSYCLDRTDTTRNCHWSINSSSLTTDYKVVTTLVMRMCHVFPVCGGWCGVCGGPALTGAVCRTLETGAAICCNCKVVTSTSLCCARCARTRVKISPQHSAAWWRGWDTLYILRLYFIYLVRETTPSIINCMDNKVKGLFI